ncbi:MAG: N-acetyltransferase [Candidatus Cloacimonetes bacterium]|nr:N-acetyltransferase [Candidatus Cloacimonadota bacterium]
MENISKIKGVFVHPTAEVSEDATIGKGTAIWNQCHIREMAQIGINCNLGKDVYIDIDVIIGNNVKIQNGVSVYHGVVIEDDVFVGPHVAFTNDLNPRAWIFEFQVYPTYVRKGASIGANSTIVCGVTIGEFAMIGAGSLVAKDVPPYCLVVGNPAQITGFVCKSGQKLDEVVELTDEYALLRCSKNGELQKIDLQLYRQVNEGMKNNS